MTRKKVALAYIANDAARRATFRKRKKGLLKKVSELSTLCGIEACAIIYSAYDVEPTVWPSAIGACHAIANFRNMPEMDQSKRMVNQPTFLQQRIGKAEEQLKKLQRDNREKEVAQLMSRALTGPRPSLQGLSLLDLSDLGWMVDKTLMEVDEKVKSLQQSLPPPPPPHPEDDNHRAPETHQGGGIMWNIDRTNIGNNKGRDQNEETAKSINGAIAVALDAMHNNQTWFMELLKPSEGLLGLSRFNNDDNNSNNNNGMVMPLPPPPPLPHPLPPYPCLGQSIAPWPNIFFP